MKKLILLLYLTLSVTFSIAQKTNHGASNMFMKYGITKAFSKIPIRSLEAIDKNKLIQEDEQDNQDGLPLRFGINKKISLDLKNGKWEETKNGRIWRLKIDARNATSINLLFDDLYLPSGAKMYVYNEENNTIFGPITDEHTNPSGQFATDVIPGNSAIIELYEPLNKKNKVKLKVNSIVQGYRNMSEYIGFGDSAPCHTDVACSQGNNWIEQSNSVAMILTDNGQRICSGTLLNTGCQDFAPNLLTAFHCLDLNGSGVIDANETLDASFWVFRFQYKSPSCGGGDGYNYFCVNGSVLLSAWNDTDFALLELNNRPPASSGVSFAGWSRAVNAPTSSVGIHHPRGDVMKISTENNAATSIRWNFGIADSHWRVEFDNGTVEHGSSGSGLFNQDGRLVGQLHGNQNNQCFPQDNNNCFCTQTIGEYGRFDVSWDGGGNPDEQLSIWLTNDPTIAETNVLPMPALLTTDAISGPKKGCYFQTLRFTLSNDPLPPNTVFEGWDWSPKLNLIAGSASQTLFVYGQDGPYNGDAWVQARFRNTCSNRIILGDRYNFMLYHDFNSGENKVRFATSPSGPYQELSNFWNYIPNGQYVYFTINDKLYDENLVKTNGDASIIFPKSYDNWDYAIYIPTQNSWNFFTFSGKEVCGNENFSQSAVFRLNRPIRFQTQSNPINGSTAKLTRVRDSNGQLSNIAGEFYVKNNMGNDIYCTEFSSETQEISIPITDKGLFHITIIFIDGSSETHRIIKN